MQQTVLITGSSGGIGYELSKRFAADGYNLVLVARSKDRLNEIAAELSNEHGIQALPISKDLSKAKACQQLFDHLQKKGVQIDVLVNNAGFGGFGPFMKTDWATESNMIQLNVSALTELTKLFGKPMAARKKGSIINVASTAAFQPGPLMAVYFATKAYVLSFSEALAAELRKKGVFVMTLCPGPTRSGFQEAAQMGSSELVKERSLPTAEELADYAFKAFKSRKGLAVHGFRNRLQISLQRLVPRRFATRVTGYLLGLRD